VRAQPQDDKLAEVTRMLAGLQYPELPQAVHARIERALAAEGAGRPSGPSRVERGRSGASSVRSASDRLRDQYVQ
jgi:hypothetical protein